MIVSMPNRYGGSFSETESLLECLVSQRGFLQLNGFWPDFVVLTSPTWVFQEDAAMAQFSDCIANLLKVRFSVAHKRVHATVHGLPQTNSYVVIVAAPPCAGPKLVDSLLTDSTTMDEPRVYLDDITGDLQFLNPRQDEHGATEMVCRGLAGQGGNIYNHYVGQDATSSRPTYRYLLLGDLK